MKTKAKTKMKAVPYGFTPQRKRLFEKPQELTKVPWSELVGEERPALEAKPAQGVLPDSSDGSDTSVDERD